MVFNIYSVTHTFGDKLGRLSLLDTRFKTKRTKAIVAIDI
jgi:hypothetical protein